MIANLLTIARIWIAAGIVTAIYYDFRNLSALLLLAAAASDVLDGFFARRLNKVSVIGDKLDHFSDLILLSATFMALTFFPPGFNKIPLWLLVVIVSHCVFQFLAWILLRNCNTDRTYVSITTPRTNYGKLIFSLQLAFAVVVLSAEELGLNSHSLDIFCFVVGGASVAHFWIDSFVVFPRSLTGSSFVVGGSSSSTGSSPEKI